jgi:hypothetical protein
MMQAGPAKANDLFARLLETSDGAVKLPWDKSPCLASGDTPRQHPKLMLRYHPMRQHPGQRPGAPGWVGALSGQSRH